LDWQIQEAKKRKVEVILAVGRKVPRWPECHIPSWAKNLSETEQQKRILLWLRKVVEHYRNEATIKIWQIENEPFLKGFGQCPKFKKEFLEKEILLVRSLDSPQFKRPVMLTTSGELSSWLWPAIEADILGTTLYRTVFIEEIKRHFRYPLRPVFYYKRAQLVKKITGLQKIVVIELQAEPWQEKALYETSVEEHFQTMNLEKLKEIIEYTRQTGFDEVYFWGVEWWYWLKERQSQNGFWEEMRKIFYQSI